ncbi:MAG TPA: flagellar basal body-associated FliL family protein [Gemmatimonadaceae bacterium]|jgi:flagellar FliL protein|nr:flagellar basal body-associated FliL family protein [Gemmatimonadota bacterium]HNV73881.1 flagellar basal body-associated FliL family protein [Gemmatimonadaceae bacterium]MBK8057561.1 flagellar basal body-associated FliL family protein [Gemmatimonadota bacterium]MBK8646505.1 flagellar basal body-associated FliL family protein [Gemmatimonadota bacterium]MBK9407451.1 flagellar basal body-associated FliL family protein [Gemmatimonadota bacterium]
MSEQPAAPAEGGEAPAKAGPKGVVLIGALVGTLLIGGAAGLFAVGPMLAKKSGYVVSAAGADSAAADGGHGDAAAAEGDAGGHGEAAAGGEGGAAANLHLVDNLVLNPAGSGGARFLMLAAALEFSDAAMVEETKARDAEVRDIVLRVMGARTVEELSEMSNREAIKKELADSLGTLFKKKKAIRRIYFPQFVIQ